MLETRGLASLITVVIISNSQASVQSKLEKFLEYQQEKRERSIISMQTVDSLSYDDRVAWRIIRQELEDIRITVTAFEANRDFILRWLSHAIQTGALEEQHAPDSEIELRPESPSASSGVTTYAESNAPTIDASTEVYPASAYYIPNPRSYQALKSSAKSGFPRMSSPLPVVSLNSTNQLEVTSLALPTSSKPHLSCERCGISTIAFELDMRCKDGNHDLCLRYWRLGLGCLDWYGFGQSVMARWDRAVGAEAGESSERPLPHFFTGRRYRCVTMREPPTGHFGDADLIAKSDLNRDLQLQSGFFCSNCSAFAQDSLLVYDICNDGELGCCVLCVTQGRCCYYPLLPVCLPFTSSMDTRLSHTTQKVSHLRMATHCKTCASLIPPSTIRFHCPPCDEGDYDVCSACYIELVKSGQVSEANGPQGSADLPQRSPHDDHRLRGID